MDVREVIERAFAMARAEMDAEQAVGELVGLTQGDREVLEAAQEGLLSMVEDLPGDAPAQRALVFLRLAGERAG